MSMPPGNGNLEFIGAHAGWDSLIAAAAADPGASRRYRVTLPFRLYIVPMYS